MEASHVRWIVPAVALLGLALLLLLLLRGNGEVATEPVDPKRTAGSSPPSATKPDPHLADELGAIARAGAEEDDHALGRTRATEAQIHAATRRFLGVYLRYELGEAVSQRELRRNTSTALAGELLADPPRFPPALDRRPLPATATQIAVSEAPHETSSASPRATVIVRLDRAGDPEAAAFTLTRTPDGRWRVTGVSG